MRGPRARTIVDDYTESRGSIWRTLSRITLAFIAIGVLGGALAAFMPELDQQKSLNRRLGYLKQKHRAAVQSRDERRAELRWLNDDAGYLELRARDRLDLYRPGEEVLRIKPDPQG